MTVTIANVNTTNTFDYWRNITNQIASAMSNVVLTTGSTTTGNTGVSGNFAANTVTIGNATVNTTLTNILFTVNAVSSNNTTVNNWIWVGNSTVNTYINSTSIAITNSSANINITVPTASQISNAQYTLNANGSWSIPANLNLSTTLSVGTTSNTVINSSGVYVSNSTANSNPTLQSLAFANSTSNLTITIPTSTQVTNGQFYLNANGTWDPIIILGTINTFSVSVGSSATLLDTWAMGTYVTPEYLVNAYDNNNNNHSSSKILVMHNTVTALSTEYAQLTSNSIIGAYNANVASGNVNVYFTPNSGFTSTTVKLVRIIM